MKTMDTVADNLRLLMERSGLDSQPKVARASGISQTHVGNILRREKTPRLDSLEKLADAFGLEVWQFLLPTDILESLTTEDLRDLTAFYAGCDSAGRKTILAVALAQHQTRPNP